MWVSGLISSSWSKIGLTPPPAQQEARQLLSLIRGYLQDTRKGEIIRSGIRLAIFGPPNAGKSSLLNFLGSYVFRDLVGRSDLPLFRQPKEMPLS